VTSDRHQRKTEPIQDDREPERCSNFYCVRVQAETRRGKVFVPLGREIYQRRPGGIDFLTSAIGVFPEGVTYRAASAVVRFLRRRVVCSLESRLGISEPVLGGFARAVAYGDNRCPIGAHPQDAFERLPAIERFASEDEQHCCDGEVPVAIPPC
jgi:hypothetical protein